MSQPPPENPPPGSPPPGNRPPGGPPPGSPPPGSPPPGYPQGGGPYGHPPPYKPSKGMAVVALVFGILAVLFCWTVLGGILFGLIALILGLVASGKAKRGTAGGRGMAIFGLLLGVLGLLISGVLIAVGAYFWGDAQNLQDCLNDAGSDQSAIDQCGREFRNDLENKVG